MNTVINAAPMHESHARKLDHLNLCAGDAVEHGAHAGLFEEVSLVHDALPELSTAELDLTTRFLDHTLRAPLMLTGMTGGPREAGEVNHALARVCAQVGVPFGLGSQRVMLRDPSCADTFRVRSSAPDVLLVGNIGVMQARDLGPERVAELARSVEADYLAIHLNPAMELVQPGSEADSDFTGGYDTIARVVDALGGRVLVKECGTGLSARVAARLASLGVRGLDASGSGGTSWVKVEALRAQGRQARLGALFSDWGIPTAAAVALCRPAAPHATLIASGGITDGLVAAKALALGADVAGLARPVLQAYNAGGADGALEFLEETIAALRIAMVLVGARTPEELRRAPRVLGPRLRAWMHPESPAERAP
jgi:isopentenyl-diphosphate delta-isomerase